MDLCQVFDQELDALEIETVQKVRACVLVYVDVCASVSLQDSTGHTVEDDPQALRCFAATPDCAVLHCARRRRFTRASRTR